MSDTSRPALAWATGLTRRELFAAMAMQGFLANEQLATQFTDELLAADAVEAADALLAELAKRGKA